MALTRLRTYQHSPRGGVPHKVRIILSQKGSFSKGWLTTERKRGLKNYTWQAISYIKAAVQGHVNPIRL